MLSLGGATPEYGLNSYEEGESLADELWYTFGGGSDTNTFRPFGDASVDGFDLDIENGAKAGYPAFVNRMREHYGKKKKNSPFNEFKIDSCYYSKRNFKRILYRSSTSMSFSRFLFRGNFR